jgi:hypothetical protein
MTSNYLSSTTTGWIAIATGASAILAVDSHPDGYSQQIFGRVNNYFTVY